MNEEINIVELTEQFARGVLEKNLPEDMVYHDIGHTLEVVETAKLISAKMSLDVQDREILMVACWLHDLGYTTTYENHEEVSKELAIPFLEKHNYANEKISRVLDCIDATKMPQAPKDILGEIICDSDLANLGKETYFKNSELIRAEWAARCPVKNSGGDWLAQEIEFLENHEYFTETAKELFQPQKELNIQTLKTMQIENSQPPASMEATKAGKKKKDKPVKKKKDFGRGVETMYRTAYRTHISLSAIADNKANILLSINAIIISITLTALIPKLDNNTYLLIPTLVLLVVCIVTIVFATLSTRPKVSMGKSTKEDILARKSNLLFFGNFFNMDINDFEMGINEMMNDNEFLYGSMSRDLYYLGKVLAKKYAYLRIGYNVFMWGLIASVLAFGFTILTI